MTHCLVIAYRGATVGVHLMLVICLECLLKDLGIFTWVHPGANHWGRVLSLGDPLLGLPGMASCARDSAINGFRKPVSWMTCGSRLEEELYN